MAIRNLRLNGDPLLRKVSRPVDEMSDKITQIIEDMRETMYDNDGVGLAAPQIGILKRIIVVDVSDIEDEEYPDYTVPQGSIVLINPEIIKSEGSQIGVEGCLSVPDYSGHVDRPSHITIRAKNENFEDIQLEARDFFARALCHEIDHLDGILYIDKLEEDETI